MPILSGCCCFDLKVGTKIIGGLCVIGSIMCILGSAFMLVFLQIFHNALTSSEVDAAISNMDDDYVEAEVQGIVERLLGMVTEHLGGVLIALYITLALSFLWLITSSLLLHGVRRNRRGFLVPWILEEAVILLLFIAIIIVCFVVYGVSVAVAIIVVGVVVTALVHLYYVLVVISQYQALGLIRMHEEISLK
ncbi:uncharacterized protein LOC143033345 [Oratosquilla oratoria]|uniref:uncharacterized protein LOC143033345 n=1 Tax=Oratosquilla oratoria TaxID=337810 RepID=UPI003F77120F